MRRQARLTSLPSNMSFLMPAGTRWAGKMEGLMSGIPVSGGVRTGTETEFGEEGQLRVAMSKHSVLSAKRVSLPVLSAWQSCCFDDPIFSVEWGFLAASGVRHPGLLLHSSQLLDVVYVTSSSRSWLPFCQKTTVRICITALNKVFKSRNPLSRPKSSMQWKNNFMPCTQNLHLTFVFLQKCKSFTFTVSKDYLTCSAIGKDVPCHKPASL